MKDILNAITYLHDYKNIAHRDLKFGLTAPFIRRLGNIMFTNTSPNAELKLIDFGLSKVPSSVPPHPQLLNRTQYTHSLVGTPYYIAPEIYLKDYKGVGYTKSCDMWSLGVITYFMLTGRNPIPSQQRDVLNQTSAFTIFYPRKFWNRLSPEARSFVEDLLQFDPVKRLTGTRSLPPSPTASQAQNHPWFRRLCSSIPHAVEPSVVESLQTFQGFNRLKKAAMTAVAYHLNHVGKGVESDTQSELAELKEAFEYFDKNQTGTITMEEFRQAIESLSQFAKSSSEVCERLEDLKRHEEKLNALFDGIDFNKTGYIDYSEFLAACLARKEGLRHEYAELLFDMLGRECGVRGRIDREGKGVIRVNDLHVFFGESIPV